MDLPDRLQRAFQRLNGALDTLDASVERRVQADAARDDAWAEHAAMGDDRSRLAGELEAALGRARALDRAAEDVSARLQRAGATLRDLMAEIAAGGGAPQA